MEAKMSPTPMIWCPDCEIYVAAHPFDHLEQRHPPEQKEIEDEPLEAA
jgi:hypothetical protein